jgi:hypothetical protein
MTDDATLTAAASAIDFTTPSGERFVCKANYGVCAACGRLRPTLSSDGLRALCLDCLANEQPSLTVGFLA